MVVESTNDTRVLEIRSKGKHFMKTMLKVAMMVVIALVSFLGVVLAYLAYPGTPDRSKFMAFDGFIKLPRGRLLTAHAFRHLGLAEPARDPSQFGLFGQSEDE